MNSVELLNVLERLRERYLSECRSVGVDFIPLVEETMGVLAKDSISTVRSIGKPERPFRFLYHHHSKDVWLSPCGGAMPALGLQ